MTQRLKGDMPKKCAAIGCRTGYRGEEKEEGVSLHKIPEDEELAREWKKRLHRKDFEAKNIFVCSKHFLDSDVILGKFQSDPLDILANCPPF